MRNAELINCGFKDKEYMARGLGREAWGKDSAEWKIANDDTHGFYATQLTCK
jgi:hypothetical protein